MAGRHHAGEVLGEQLLRFRNHRARRRERRHAAVGRPRRGLDAGVGVLLVVVADDQAVVIPVERARNRGQPDVGRAAVARLADDVRKRALPLALADHRFVGGGDAGGEAAGAADLRVRPGHVVGRAEIRAVGDVHAAGRPDQDRVVARRLARHPVLDRRPAAGARPVAGNERLGRRQFGVVETRPLIRAAEHRQHLPLNFNGWHRSSRITRHS